MCDKIIKTSEELGNMIITYKDGKQQTVQAKTVYTNWESGRKDCAIQLIHPIDTVAKKEN